MTVLTTTAPKELTIAAGPVTSSRTVTLPLEPVIAALPLIRRAATAPNRFRISGVPSTSATDPEPLAR